MTVETSSVAGVVAGRNPLKYAPGTPYTIFLFQAVFIILLCQIVHYPLSKLRQPKVIAEVVTGIILGPSVLGHAGKFTATCFPKESIPGLTLFANIGIILFLFIVGLEVDLKYIKKHLKTAISIGLVNMSIPFAFGAGISKGMYDQYRENDPDLPHIKFTTFMVFIAVAMCITAFPVLARILTELNLLADRVGTAVLAAGIMNDLTGWILLALSVTLVNASNPVNTVYILLLTFAWFLFLVYPVRKAMIFCLQKFSNDLITGEPSQLLMMAILVLVFVSAFYTDIIGVHPIFGAFMVGVIVPRDNGYVIKITEKLEDLVHIVLIPIYFAVTGLNVNLGLLNKRIDWAYIIGIILLALVGKIFGGFIAAKCSKMLWRESLAVGVLMSCKGIVEIVVLSVGLTSGIISQKLYSMFVVMALVTTFLTTPLTIWVYPISYREEVARYHNDKEYPLQSMPLIDDSASKDACDEFDQCEIGDLILLVKGIDTISYLMHFMRVFSGILNEGHMTALHLREFTSRTSNLLEVSSNYEEVTKTDDRDYIHSSSILSIMKVFGEFLGVHCNVRSILAPPRNYVLAINDQIPNRTALLFMCMRADHFLKDIVGNSESLPIKLIESIKCNIGFLLVNNLNPYGTIDEEHELKLPETTNDFRVVNLILVHHNILSATDIYSLFLVTKMLNAVESVNIFFKGQGAERPYEIERKVQQLLLKFATLDVGIHYFDSLKNKKSTQQPNQLYLIPTNVQQGSAAFGQETLEVIEESLSFASHILLVKASA